MSVSDGFKFGLGLWLSYLVLGVLIALIMVPILWNKIGAVRVYTDDETGCQYIKFIFVEGDPQPRLNSDGEVMCGAGR